MITFSYFLMTLLMFAGLFLIGLVLLQRGRGGGLAGAFGGMGGQSAFGTKAGDVFTRITIGVAAAWILLCAGSVVALHNSSGGRITAGADPAAIKAAEADKADRAKANSKGADANDDEDPIVVPKSLVTPPADHAPVDPSKSAVNVEEQKPDEQKPDGDPVKAAPTEAKPEDAAPRDDEKSDDPKPEASEGGKSKS